jgi:hypothetical protein
VILLLVFTLLLALQDRATSDSYDIPAKATDSVSGCPKQPWPRDMAVSCFYRAATLFRNHATKWRGTECPGQSSVYAHWGHCACAAVASIVIMNASLVNLAMINVDEFRSLANSGKYGGSLVEDKSAVPGDVILWYSNDLSEGHIGFCATKKCKSTWSNSSSLGTFAPESHSIDFDGFYPRHFIWHPQHLP